jgi:hypothetical protein
MIDMTSIAVISGVNRKDDDAHEQEGANKSNILASLDSLQSGLISSELYNYKHVVFQT